MIPVRSTPMVRDVVIAGGGPIRLMLACELRLADVSVTVLERLAEPNGSSKLVCLDGRSIDLLGHRGLLGRLWDGDPPKFLNVQQHHVEELLEERALELGAALRWGHALVGLRRDREGMTLEVRDPNGDYQLRALSLVGCDGEQGVVRELVGSAPFASETAIGLQVGGEGLPVDVSMLNLRRLARPIGARLQPEHFRAGHVFLA